jgi:hypothetical protein
MLAVGCLKRSVILNPLHSLHAEAIEFFERYRTEFDSCRWTEFTSLFHEPCLTVRGDGTVRYLNSHEDAAPFFESVAQTWREEGYHRFATENFEVLPIGRTGILVTFDWIMLGEADVEIRRWRQSYQLVRIQERIQVLTSMFHGS